MNEKDSIFHEFFWKNIILIPKMFGAARQFFSSIQNEHIFLGATRLFLPILSPLYGTGRPSESKIFARAFGAIDIMYRTKWSFCAAGKNILRIFERKTTRFSI